MSLSIQAFMQHDLVLQVAASWRFVSADTTGIVIKQPCASSGEYLGPATGRHCMLSTCRMDKTNIYSISKLGVIKLLSPT